MAKWFRTLIFSTLNHSSFHRCGFEPSSGHVRQAKFCLLVVRWFFSWISQFCPTFRLAWLKMSDIILTGRKTQIKKKRDDQHSTVILKTPDNTWFITYRKFPKYSDTQKIWCNHSKILTMWLCHRVMSPNDADGMANSVDPDQTAPLIWVCTVCPGISVRKLRKIMVDQHCLCESFVEQCGTIQYESLLTMKSYLSHLMTKPTKWHVRPVKPQIPPV